MWDIVIRSGQIWILQAVTNGTPKRPSGMREYFPLSRGKTMPNRAEAVDMVLLVLHSVNPLTEKFKKKFRKVLDSIYKMVYHAINNKEHTRT